MPATRLSDELIVIGTTDAGILLYDGATWRQLDKDNSVLSTNRVQAVLVDQDGQIWAGTDAGLFRLNRDGQGVAFNQANTNGEIGSDNIAALAGLRTTDVLWMAHPRHGISGFDGDSWSRYRSDNSLMPSSEVRALRLIPGTAGGLMLATAGGAVLYDQVSDDWYIYDTGNSGIVSNNVTAVAVDAGGGLWFGTGDGGLTRTRNPLTWDQFGAGDGLGSNNVRDIFVASDGTVWVATSRGVSWLEDNQFSTSNVLNAGLPSNSVRALAEDGQGRIWIATDGGVGSFDGSTWTAFTTAQGLPTSNASSIAVGRVVGN